MKLKYLFTWEDVPQDWESLKQKFTEFLNEISKEGKKITIVLDALNQLDDTNRSHTLDWLPNVFPKYLH